MINPQPGFNYENHRGELRGTVLIKHEICVMRGTVPLSSGSRGARPLVQGGRCQDSLLSKFPDLGHAEEDSRDNSCTDCVNIAMIIRRGQMGEELLVMLSRPGWDVSSWSRLLWDVYHEISTEGYF